jgi:AraC-like DNA-binding protein
MTSMLGATTERFNGLDARLFISNARLVDILQDHLARARASGGLFARSVAHPPWGLRLPGTIQLAVHAVVEGRAWLWLDQPQAAVELVPGVVAVVRGGPDHYLAHEPGARCLSPEDFRASHNGATGEQASVFLCGAYQFAGDVGRALVEALPPVLRLTVASGDRLRDVVDLLSRELAEAAPGQQTVLDRLLDVLLVLIIRTSLQQSAHPPPWYRASVDPRLGPALSAMHTDPGYRWTVPELAARSGLSRAAFARSFRKATGQAPMQYLTDWRMTLARDHLRTGTLSIAQIAGHTGYATPYAFATAFRRQHGHPPGRWRRAAADRSDSRPHNTTDH